MGAGRRLRTRRLTPIVHGELRKIARKYMAHERRNHTLQPTALINEAYVRLVHMRQPSWQSRAHFFALSAQIMRRILVDFARARLHQNAEVHIVTLDDALLISKRVVTWSRSTMPWPRLRPSTCARAASPRCDSLAD